MKAIAREPLVILLAILIQCANGAEVKVSSKTNSPGPDTLFSQPGVLKLKIEVPSANLDSLKKQPKTYVKAVIREGEQVYSDVGVRLKGNAPYESQEKKPSLTVKFNEFTSTRLFHGHSRIILDNAHHDPAYLSEAIGSEVFRAADVPAAKVTFARVELNGRDLGLYVIEQAANKEFLTEHFKKSKGNLYEGAHNDVEEKLEKDSGDSATDQSDLKKLAAAARDPDAGQRLKKLQVVLDVDRFISFAAAEVLTWHHTGYAMARDNYRVYHDPNTDRMVFIPHSLDQLFAKTNGALLPEWKGLVAKSILSTPEGQRRYRERMSALLSGACKVEMLHERLAEFAAKIRPALAQDADEAAKFDKAVALLRDRIAQRARFLEDELKKSGA